MPSASMKVLFPHPGTPVMPTRRDLPVWGRMESSSRAARSASAGRWLSMRVMARARVTRSPRRTPSMYWSSGSLPRSITLAMVLRGTNAARERGQDLLRTGGDDGARAEHADDTSLIEVVVVLRRNHAADEDEDVAAAELLQFGDDF